MAVGRFVLGCAVAFVFGAQDRALGQSGDSAYVKHVQARLLREATNLEGERYVAAQAAVIEVTERSQTRRFFLRLEKGVQYAFIAACDQDCSHVELSLLDGQRNVIAKTPEKNDVVILGGAPPVSPPPPP